MSFNNTRFKEFISDIFLKDLTISETTESTLIASYLDLLFIQDKNNNITTKLYAFSFQIVNFPFMSSNIPSASACGVYASQLICWLSILYLMPPMVKESLSLKSTRIWFSYGQK